MGKRPPLNGMYWAVAGRFARADVTDRGGWDPGPFNVPRRGDHWSRSAGASRSGKGALSKVQESLPRPKYEINVAFALRNRAGPVNHPY